MSSVSRFKIGLLLWLIVTVCLGMAISTGMQSFGPEMQLSGMMPAVGSPGQFGQPGQAHRPVAGADDRTRSLNPAGPTGGNVSAGPVVPLLPIHWTTAVALRDLNELVNPEPVLNRPINFPNRADRFTMVDARGKAAQVKTIGDYLRLKSQGCRAKTASDSALEVFAKAQLYPLIYLHRAVGARQSFVSDFDITTRPLATLPALLGPVLSADQAAAITRRAAGSASRRGLEGDLLAPSARVTVIDKNTIRIADRSAEVRLTVLAWGDFNRDGLEDVLISATTFARGGTVPKHFAVAVLTRKTQTGPLTVVDYQP